MKGKFKNTLLLFVLFLFVAQCAQEVGDIDRTQPNKIKKSDLAGLWYVVQTVIDVPYPSSVSFNGEVNFGGGAKIIWDIQEKYLIAYPVTEYIHGSEKKWHKRKIRNYWEDGKENEFIEIYTGQPIAAFEIESHFDIKRKYNPQTGEQTNIIEENNYDKKWWERKYIRVNWAKNVVKDYTFLARISQFQPVDYYVQEWETDNPDRPTVTKDYIDVVTKYYIEPEPYGCDIYSASTGDCAGTIVKIRNSFRKVPVIDDYIPWRYRNEEHQDLFGFFLTERYSYDEKWGETYQGKISLINRWNIWKKSKEFTEVVKNPDGTEKTCILKSDCDEENHEYCIQDDWFVEGKCWKWKKIPEWKREVKPIIYHMSVDMPKELLKENYELADNWNDVLQETVAWLKYWGEKGMFEPRECTTNADCNQHALFDDEIDMDEPKTCEKNEDCGGGDIVCKDKVCKKQIACDENNICPYYGQQCKNGYCYENDKQVFIDQIEPKAHTVIFGKLGEDKIFNLVLVDNLYGSYSSADPHAVVRLVVADPNAKGLSLVFKTQDNNEVEVVKDAKFELDPQNETSKKIVGYERFDTPAFGEVMVNAIVKDKSGKVVGEYDFVRIKGGENHLFVYAGNGKLFHYRSDWNPQGLRVINLIEDGLDIDVGINSALRKGRLHYGNATEYEVTGSGAPRLTIIKSGDRTDVTCYYYNTKGYCTGWKPSQSDAEYKQTIAKINAMKKKMEPIFVLCENVFNGDDCDPEMAKKPFSERKNILNDCRYSYYDEKTGTVKNPCRDNVVNPYMIKKHGDIRYNLVYWVGEEQAASPLGYGPSSADPDTGEIFHATANVYGAPMMTYAQYMKDLLDLLNGKKHMEDNIAAQYIVDYVDSHKNEKDTAKSLYAALKLQTGESNFIDIPDELHKMIVKRLTTYDTPDKILKDVAIDLDRFDKKVDGSVKDPELIKILSNPKLLKALNKGKLFSTDANYRMAQLEKIKGTPIASILANKELKYGISGNLDGIMPDGSSPDDFDFLKEVFDAYQKEHERMTILAKNNVFMSDFMDDAVISMAKRLGCNLPPEVEQPTTDIYDPNLGNADRHNGVCPQGEKCTCIEDPYLLMWAAGARVYGGVVEHEVGHTLGLRHNFRGSNDIFNFPKKYWETRLAAAKQLNIYTPCKNEDWCEGGQTCFKDCGSDSDCFLDGQVCHNGKCAYQKDGEYIETGVCVWATKYKFCSSSSDCPQGYVCSMEDFICEKEVAGKKCNGFSQPCAEGQVCKNGFCKNPDGSNPKEPLIVYDEASGSLKTVIPVKQVVPRVGITTYEQNNARAEYQTSSIMDYGGTINFDIHGPGLYDRAAIKFGYGKLIEVYAHPEYMNRYAKVFSKSSGLPDYFYSFIESSEMMRWSGGFFSYWTPYFYFNNVIGGIANNYKRISVPYLFYKFDNEMSKAFNREQLDVSFKAVPYRYCGDEWRGNTACYYFDLGSDMAEIVYHSYNKLHDYYIFDAFKRQSFAKFKGGKPNYYFARILDRWLPPLKDAGMSYAFAVGLLSKYQGWEDWADNYMEGYNIKLASTLAFQYLSQLIASPAPGSFKKMVDADGSEIYKNIDYFMGNKDSELDVPIGDGKFPYTTFWFKDDKGNPVDMGYYYFDHPLFAGSFWEKLAAFITLTDSTAVFLSDYVGEALDVGVGTSIGFNTIYQTELTNLLGSFIADRLDMYAGYAAPGDNGKMKFHFRNIFNPQESKDYVPVEPSIHNLGMKIYAAVFGLIYMPAAFNTSFIDSLAVFLKGSGEEYYLDGVDKVEFVDPFSQKIYVAYKPNFSTKRIAPAYELVKKTKELVELYNTLDENNPDEVEQKIELESRIKDYIMTLDMLRVLHKIYGVIKY